MKRALYYILMGLALVIEGLAIALTIAGIPAYLRELESYLNRWLSEYVEVFDLLLAFVFYATAGLILFRGAYNVQWAYLTAALLRVTLPVIFIFYFAQRSFIEGIGFMGTRF